MFQGDVLSSPVPNSEHAGLEGGLAGSIILRMNSLFHIPKLGSSNLSNSEHRDSNTAQNSPLPGTVSDRSPQSNSILLFHSWMLFIPLSLVFSSVFTPWTRYMINPHMHNSHTIMWEQQECTKDYESTGQTRSDNGAQNRPVLFCLVSFSGMGGSRGHSLARSPRGTCFSVSVLLSYLAFCYKSTVSGLGWCRKSCRPRDQWNRQITEPRR